MKNLHFFKRPGQPVYIMIDADALYMRTVTAGNGVNSVTDCDKQDHVKRTLMSFADGRDIEPISFDEYFYVAANVDAVQSQNYGELFNLYFGL